MQVWGQHAVGKTGDRVKTDRRDIAMSARLHRTGELTAVWLPGAAHEAMRDLVRARASTSLPFPTHDRHRIANQEPAPEALFAATGVLARDKPEPGREVSAARKAIPERRTSDTARVGELRSNGRRKHHPSNLPADVAIKEIAGAIKARRICDQAHLQINEKHGLEHFEGCSWTGPRHALIIMSANVFLQTRSRAQNAREKPQAHRLGRACRPSDTP